MTQIPPELEQKMTELNGFDFKTLEKNDFGKDYNFKEASKRLETIYNDFLDAVNNFSVLELPIDDVNKVVSVANRLSDYIKQIQEFSMDTGSIEEIKNRHQTIHQQIENLYQEDLKTFRPIIRDGGLVKMKPEEVERQITAAANASKEIEKIKQEIRDEATNAKKEVEKTIKEVQDALGKGGAVISSNEFEEQSKTHAYLAKWWFRASLASIALAIGIVVVLFKTTWIVPSIDQATDPYKIIHAGIFKVVLLSFIYVLVYQSVKNYKINKHLHVLNRHRQLSLTVYPIMVKASNDPAHSNIVASQAAKAIFDQNTTGYLDGDDTINPINLTEIINKIASKK